MRRAGLRAPWGSAGSRLGGLQWHRWFATGAAAATPTPGSPAKKPAVDFTSVEHWDGVATAGYDDSIFGYFNEDFAKQVCGGVGEAC